MSRIVLTCRPPSTITDKKAAVMQAITASNRDAGDGMTFCDEVVPGLVEV